MCSSGGMHGSQETRTKMQSLENGVITWYYIRCHVMKDQGYHVKTFRILSFFSTKMTSRWNNPCKIFQRIEIISRKKYSELLKFIYSEKATKFCEIFPLLLTTVHTVKSKRKISQNFVAFSEYMNFIYQHINDNKLFQWMKHLEYVLVWIEKYNT